MEYDTLRLSQAIVEYCASLVGFKVAWSEEWHLYTKDELACVLQKVVEEENEP